MADPGSKDVDACIASLGGWRAAKLKRLRRLILQAVPEMAEEVKWRKPSNPDGVAVWSRHGIVCTGEGYQDKVKLTFPRGSQVPDPTGLFNASLAGVRRAIDMHEADDVDEAAFKQLVSAAAAANAP